MWIVNDTDLGEHASKKSKSVHGFVTGNWMAVIILQSLLDEPNPNSPANSLAAQLYQENKREYEKKVIAIVEQSCLSNWWPRYSQESWKEHNFNIARSHVAHLLLVDLRRCCINHLTSPITTNTAGSIWSRREKYEWEKYTRMCVSGWTRERRRVRGYSS